MKRWYFFSRKKCLEILTTINRLRTFTKLRSSRTEVFLEISQNSQENTCARVSFFIKLQPSACNFIKKETLVQVFSCEFCEISKNTFSYKTPLVAASESFWIPTQSVLRLCSFPFQKTSMHTLKLDHHQLNIKHSGIWVCYEIRYH